MKMGGREKSGPGPTRWMQNEQKSETGGQSNLRYIRFASVLIFKPQCNVGLMKKRGHFVVLPVFLS